MDRFKRYFGLAGAVVGGVAGFYLIEPVSALLKTEFRIYEAAGVVLFGAVFLGMVSYFAGPTVATIIAGSVKWLEKKVVGAPLQDIVVGAGGLIVGLIIANLLAPSLARIPLVGSFLPSIALVILGYIGIAVARSKKDDLLTIGPWRTRTSLRTARSNAGEARAGVISARCSPKLLDTSTIIDGRIIDICKTGFIEGALIVPDFVLDELRRIADSSDNLKRNKGRRGLDTLNTLQKDMGLDVITTEMGPETDLDVDARLLKLAKSMDASLVTTDYNLAKIAELQQIKVLNINQLANALKLMVAPGEELSVHILKEGQQPGQGVGYLDDGTMVVVDQARKHIGETIQVVVTNVHATAAGRMIFARPKYLDRAASDVE